jgi:hypothetical protein
MNTDQKDDIRKLFMKQYKIMNEIDENLKCDLYLCFEGEEEIKKLERKLNTIKKIRTQLIRIYSTIVSEF